MVLSDKSVYHSFFRTVPSDELLSAALATTMNRYKWQRLAIITEDEQQYEVVSPWQSCMVSSKTKTNVNSYSKDSKLNWPGTTLQCKAVLAKVQ